MREPGQGTPTTKGYWRVVGTAKDLLGRPIRKAFERKTLLAAQRARDAWLAQQGNLKETGTFGELAEIVEAYIWKSVGEAHRRNMLFHSRHWRKYLEEIEVHTITAPILTRIHNDLTKGKSGSFINANRTCIRTILGYAVSDLGWIENNPAENIRSPKPTKSKLTYPPMTGEEYQRMLSIAPPHIRPIIQILGDCGMRPKEAVAVRKEHLFTANDRWLVRIPKSKTDAGVRVVPISDQLMREIEQIDERYWKRHGIKDPADHVRKWWRENSKTRMYDLRGWRSDEWRRAGIPDQVRTYLLGHVKPDFTQKVYETITTEDVLNSLLGKRQ